MLFIYAADLRFLVYQSIHTAFDAQGVIVYPIQSYVLDAVDKYLDWLDRLDEGKAWDNQQGPVEYFKILRSTHPFLVCYSFSGSLNFPLS